MSFFGADADELLRKAQFEFQNVGAGSTDSEKHAAKAKSLARKIISKYPDSREVAAARLILEQLGERMPAPSSQEQHVHAIPDGQHDPQSHPGAEESNHTTGSVTRSASGTQSASSVFPFALPGWPLRLVQATSVVFGVYLILENIGSLQRLDIEGLLFLSAGAFFIYFPRMAAFAGLVDRLKSMVFVSEDWSANPGHLPTSQDIDELVSAAMSGNKNKLLILVFALFVLSGFFMLLAAAVYVVGGRKAFDAVEGWLLDRKTTAAQASIEEAADPSPDEPPGQAGADIGFWLARTVRTAGLLFGVATIAVGLGLSASGVNFINEGNAPGASIMAVMGLFLFLAPGVVLVIIGFITTTRFVGALRGKRDNQSR